jgi:hypothetical protein
MQPPSLSEIGPTGKTLGQLHRVVLQSLLVEAFINADVIWYQEHLADDFVCPESEDSALGSDRNAMTETSSWEASDR